MKTITRQLKGPGAVELLEQAAGLVRRASARTLCCYYLGSMPFAFGFLYFCADMGGAAGAADRLIPESFALVVLYLWMKCWQSVYAHRLRAELMHVSPEPVAPVRLALVQGILQPWWFILAPITLLVFIPFGWCFALFQNVTVLGCDGNAATVLAKARRLAGFRHGRHTVIFLFFAAFSLAVFLNLLAGASFLPKLLKSLLGLETVFTRSSHVLSSSTFLLFLALATYLCVDPFVKAVYVLSCFHGDAIASGSDLLAELRALQRTVVRTAMILVFVSLCVMSHPLSTSASSGAPVEPPPVPSTPAVDAGELDRAIGKVITRDEFSWRLPEQRGQTQERQVPGFMKAIRDTLSDWLARIDNWRKSKTKNTVQGRRLNPMFRNSAATTGWIPIAMYALVAVFMCGIGIFLWRRFRPEKKTGIAPATSEVASDPDISDQAVTAAELSEDRWYRLSRELLARGEARLALRALYFSSIVHLSEEGLLTVDKTKSDRDYERELKRRAHSRPELVDAFSGNVSLYQCTWYGTHPAPDLMDIFTSNYQRIVGNDR